MLVNADFSSPAAVTPDQYNWVASPQTGVHRVMLDRVGGELARATSIVRYAEGSRFPPHRHPGGEEILVLSGVFSDEGGDYPAGWYLRNPPGSSHAPSSAPGATIFVKLLQMSPQEQTPVRIDTRDPAHWTCDGAREQCFLFDDGSERVRLERLPLGDLRLALDTGPAEVLVLQGALRSAVTVHPQGSWLRVPAAAAVDLHSGPERALVYVKTVQAFPVDCVA